MIKEKCNISNKCNISEEFEQVNIIFNKIDEYIKLKNKSKISNSHLNNLDNKKNKSKDYSDNKITIDTTNNKHVNNYQYKNKWRTKSNIDKDIHKKISAKQINTIITTNATTINNNLIQPKHQNTNKSNTSKNKNKVVFDNKKDIINTSNNSNKLNSKLKSCKQNVNIPVKKNNISSKNNTKNNTTYISIDKRANDFYQNQLKSINKKEAKINEMRKYNEQKELQELQTGPKLFKNNAYSANIKKDFLSRAEEYQDSKMKKITYLKEVKKQQEEEEINFTETLRICNVKNKKKLTEEEIQASVNKMLEKNIKIKAKLELMKQNYEKQQIKECSFKPKINNNYYITKSCNFDYYNQDNSDDSNGIVSRLYDKDIKHRNLKRNLLLEAFSPIISQINKNIRFDSNINSQADKIYYQLKEDINKDYNRNNYSKQNANLTQIYNPINTCNNRVNSFNEFNNNYNLKKESSFNENNNTREDIFNYNPSTISNMLNLFSLDEKRKMAQEINQSKESKSCKKLIFISNKNSDKEILNYNRKNLKSKTCVKKSENKNKSYNKDDSIKSNSMYNDNLSNILY